MAIRTTMIVFNQLLSVGQKVINLVFQKQQPGTFITKQPLVWSMAAMAVVVLFLSSSVGLAQQCTIDWTAQYDPRNPNQDRDETNGPVPIIDADDVIGYSADGNRVDEDDIAATPLALSIFAKRGWKNQLVHHRGNSLLRLGLIYSLCRHLCPPP